MIPYGRQAVDDDDIAAVVEALRSDWLTTGPQVKAFEAELAASVGAAHGVAVSSGTAALHAAAFALGLGPGDEVIVPPITFAATSNAVLYMGATPVFADVLPDSLLIDPAQVARSITPRTRAIFAVDYAGHPCAYAELQALAQANNLALLADACHALGAQYHGAPVGAQADITVFSFHPVKHLTTGEGGMAVTNNDALAARMRSFRTHGVSQDFHQRATQGTWEYDMSALGFNYRITDIQCALGRTQLRKVPGSVARRQAIAARYDAAFAGLRLRPLAVSPDVSHAYHLYVILLDEGLDRAAIFAALRERGIGVNVHYRPVYLHSYYRNLGYPVGLCPVAEAAYARMISLPMFPTLSDEDQATVIAAVTDVVGA